MIDPMVAPYRIAPGELRTSPFLARRGGTARELVSGVSFELSAAEEALLVAADDGIATAALAADARPAARALLARRLLLDAEALRQIGAYTIGQLDLEIAGACNAECTFCPREPLKTGRGVGLMRAETFHALLERLGPYLRFVGFAGIGEPTLHRQLPEFVRALTSRGINTALVTNGSLLGDELIGALLDAGVGAIQVSFNGLDKRSYEEHMVGLDFEATLARVERLVTLTRGRVPLYLSAVETAHNGAALAGFVEHWRARGVAAEIVPCHSRGGTIVPLRRNAEAAELGLRCALFASRAFVSWDGRVLACCHDVDGGSELGRVTSDSAETIIARKLDVMRGSEWFRICGGCDEPARLFPVQLPPRPPSV
jgi:hypothetical protein